MARAYYVNGETMVLVKGRTDSPIANLSQLGLCDGPIEILTDYKELPIKVDAYGYCPPEIQAMGMMARVNMTLVHFDNDILKFCVQEACGGAPTFGTLGHAGQLFGNGLARFQAGTNAFNGNHFIGLNLQSAAGQQAWRFYFAYLAQQPLVFPVGAERTLARLSWLAVPYSADPWNNGNGSYGVPVFDNTLDA